MITHAPKKKNLDKPGEVLKVRVRVTSVTATRAEVILEDGKHEVRELVAGEVVTVPIWSGLDLVNRGMAIYA